MPTMKGGQGGAEAEVESDAARGLFDDVAGASGVLLLTDPTLHNRLRPQDTTLLASLGWKVLTLASTVIDTHDTAWMRELGSVAVLVRPDHYLYGAATDTDDILALLDHLRTALHQATV